MTELISVHNLNAWFGSFQALRNINIKIMPGESWALIGPSGCGKSTFLRCLNRLHEETPGARSEGKILLNNRLINDWPAVELRQHIGMVFQKPSPFPSFSVLDNTIIGPKVRGGLSKKQLREKAEYYLQKVGLWNEVKDKLHYSGQQLSGGQQQRLCIARALAVEPDILLMDEPTSALDPISTKVIEELIKQLRKQIPIIIVTHNLQQAHRVADNTAFFYMGELIEAATTTDLFNNPKHEKTKDYVQGRFS